MLAAVAFTALFLEHAELDPPFVFQDREANRGPRDVGRADFSLVPVGCQEDLRQGKGVPGLLVLEAVHREDIPGLYCKLPALNVYDCFHKTMEEKWFLTKRQVFFCFLTEKVAKIGFSGLFWMKREEIH